MHQQPWAAADRGAVAQLLMLWLRLGSLGLSHGAAGTVLSRAA
jgi:hypothetical protein